MNIEDSLLDIVTQTLTAAQKYVNSLPTPTPEEVPVVILAAYLAGCQFALDTMNKIIAEESGQLPH